MKTLAPTLTAFWCLALLLPAVSEGQAGPFGFRFQNYSTRQGLSANQALCVADDADGFIWTATQDGVSRFDGLSFRVFQLKLPDSASNPARNVLNTVKRVGGEIWALNRVNEFFRFDQGLGRFVFVRAGVGSPPVDKLHWFHPDFLHDRARGCLWQTGPDGLWKIPLGGDPPEPFQILEKNANNDEILQDPQGRLWLATETGEVCFDPATGRATKWASGRKVVGHALLGNDLWFVGELDSAFRVDLRGGSLTAVALALSEKLPGDQRPQAERVALFPAMTGDSILWIGLYDGGLVLFDLKTGREAGRFGEESAQWPGYKGGLIRRFYLASDSLLWLGTDDGLAKIDHRQQFFTTTEVAHFKKNGIGRIRNVLSDARRPGTKWVLTNSDGPYELDERTGATRKLPFCPPGNDIGLKEMQPDGQGGIQFLGNEAVYRYLPDGQLRKTAVPFFKKERLRHFAVAGRDSIWVATIHGMGLLLPATGEFMPVRAEFGDIFRLNPGDGGSVLVSTAEGLFRAGPAGFDPGCRCFATVEKLPGMGPDKKATAAVEVPGAIWGLSGSGLGRLDKQTGQWQFFGEKEGLSNLRARSLLRDGQGHFWLNTDNGLFVFFPEEGRFKRYSEDDGLAQNLMQGILSGDGGWIHAPFSSSFSSWKPNARLQKVAKKPVFTGFWALGRAVSLRPDSLGSAEFEVRHSENILRFEFTCTDFYQSEKITFEYLLEGFDQRPEQAGTVRSATYTNLDGGRYALKVWAINADGYRCAEPAVLRFRVVPPFHRTWWFFALALAAACGAVYAIYQNRLRQRLEKEAIRLRIARDLHDEVGSTLTTISILSESALRGVELDLEKNRLAGIGEKARSALSSMGDIVWAVNPQNDPLEKVVERMTRFAAEALEPAGIAPRFEVGEGVERLALPMEKRKDFYLFFKEAVTNVAKHSRAREAVFSLKKENGQLVLEITDDGSGLPERPTGDGLGGNGLRNMAARAAALGAVFLIENGGKSGVRIRLATPIT